MSNTDQRRQPAPVFHEGWGAYHAYVDAELRVELGDDYYIVATIREDSSSRPWDDAGHGDVTEWLTRPKAPGELVLCTSRHSGTKRFYDFAGACKTALRDAWGPTKEGETKRQTAARCAREDFEILRRWCDNQWFYCGIVVAVELNDVELASDSLWGIECNYPGSDNAFLLEVANELAPEVIEEAYVEAASRNLSTTTSGLCDA